MRILIVYTLALFLLTGCTPMMSVLVWEDLENGQFHVVGVKEKDQYSDVIKLPPGTKEGDVIFEKDYSSNGLKEVQYYSLGVDKQLYIVRDVDTRKIYLYNKSGTLINSDILLSDYAVSVVYRKSLSMCYIYTANAQSVEVNYFSF